jgi:3-oxoacyl-[acyl-carrier protein] reductase
MGSAPDRVALVTGSSRGLGRVIAQRLACDGLAVAVNGLHGDGQLSQVVGVVRDAGGVADAFAADVTDQRQVTELVAAVADRLGPIGVLVVNATGPQPEAPVAEVVWEEHLAQLGFFVKSPVLLGRAALPGMRKRRWGRIIQIDSEVAHRMPPGRSAYATAKNAQIGLTRSWARELAPFGITVNTVAPGLSPWSATPMSQERSEARTWPRCLPGGWARPRTSPTRSASSPRRRRGSSPASG